MANYPYKRTAHRWRLAAVVGAFLLLALGSFYIVQLMDLSEMKMQAATGDEPDYIVEKFSVVRMTPQGTPQHIISGSRMEHLPATDTSVITRPMVQSMSPDKPPLFIRAEQGVLTHATNTVELKGKVNIEREATPTSKRMTVRTEALTVLPDEERMLTRQPVEITTGAAVVRGSGMAADNARRTLRIDDARMQLPNEQRQP